MNRNRTIRALEQTQGWHNLKSRNKSLHLTAAKAVKKFVSRLCQFSITLHFIITNRNVPDIIDFLNINYDKMEQYRQKNKKMDLH